MQAMELETNITHGEIHLRLPQTITAEKVKVIVLFEDKPAEKPASNEALIDFLDGLAGQSQRAARGKEEIDQMLDEERAAWD